MHPPSVRAHPLDNPDYGKIINEKHFNRVLGLMKGVNVRIGGGSRKETLQIEPTVLTEVTPSSPVMQEEIFGPLLPVMTFREISEVITYVTRHEKPLALYLFTGSRAVQRQILKYCSSEADASTTRSSISRRAGWDLAVSAQAVWEAITAETVLSCSATAGAL